MSCAGAKRAADIHRAEQTIYLRHNGGLPRKAAARHHRPSLRKRIHDRTGRRIPDTQTRAEEPRSSDGSGDAAHDARDTAEKESCRRKDAPLPPADEKLLAALKDLRKVSPCARAYRLMSFSPTRRSSICAASSRKRRRNLWRSPESVRQNHSATEKFSSQSLQNFRNKFKKQVTGYPMTCSIFYAVLRLLYTNIPTPAPQMRT